MRKIIFAIIVAVLVSITGVAWNVSGATEISVTVDGKVVIFPDAKSFIDENGRTLIPVRFVTEDLGATVEWNEKLQEVKIRKNEVNISVRINDRDIVVNNRIKTMDTKAIIKESRTYVPIRYVAESLGATVGWNASTKTVIITTGTNTDKSYVGDFYEINLNMPQELYTYEYKKDPFDGLYATNKELVNKFGVSQATDWMKIAKNYIETCYNVDYQTLNKKEYVENLRWYFMPGTKWYGGDGVGRPILEHLEYLANTIVEKQLVMKIQYTTDPSLVLSNGNFIIRGRVVYTIENCNDMNWLNKFLPFGKSELDMEHLCDFEVELANLQQKDGWEHSVYVLYNLHILSILK